jgi:hypothetical protein
VRQPVRSERWEVIGGRRVEVEQNGTSKWHEVPIQASHAGAGLSPLTSHLSLPATEPHCSETVSQLSVLSG